MQETWNKFVYDLCEAKKRNMDESEYHSLIENQFQLLEWAKYKGEICHKPTIPIGNNNSIYPDILIKKDGEEQFVIEVKRPVHVQKERESQQLVSYMRQLKLKVGIYIGEHIEVFYDQPDNKDVISVIKVDLELDSTKGAKFMELFSKRQFDKANIVAFCEDRIKEMQRQKSLNKIRENLISEDGKILIRESLTKYLTEKYRGNFVENEIDKMLSTLKFIIIPKDTQIPLSPIVSSKEIPATEQKQASKSSIRYSLNGGDFLYINRFVFAVVREYVKLHPNASFENIKDKFPDDIKSQGVVQSLDYVKNKNYKGKRFFMNKDEIIISGDNISFVVSNQWNINTVQRVIEIAEDLGFIVKSNK